MSTIRPLTRRVFLRQFGTTSFAIAVLGLSACTGEDTTGEPTTTDGPAGTSTPPPQSSAAIDTTVAASGTEPLEYRRVDFGFVSAYILIRSGSAAIVDTGVAGSGPDIEAGLTAVDLGWNDVEHLILTHRHGDHVGSADAVLSAAASATAYAGAADIPQIQVARPIVAVGDGDEVFGLQIIHTPGHTDGHISVLDRIGGVLVAGDALNGANGGVIGPNPDFSSDMEAANQSVKKLAGLPFDTVLFGHGEPVEVGAGALVASLAADL